MSDEGCLYCGIDIAEDTPYFPFCTLGCREQWWRDGVDGV